MRPGHFFLMLNEYNRRREQDFRLDAELVRAQTTTLVNVQVRKEDRKTPQQLWPLPWDEEHDQKKRLNELNETELKEAYKKFIKGK